jgi:aarF domain-containing kinase
VPPTLDVGVPTWTGLPLSDARADDAYAALHDKHAGNVRDLVLRMRGFYFKNAQMLSTRDDFIPPQYLEWCKQTQDAAPTEMAPGEARAIVAEQFASIGHPDAIAEWDENPVGVASIGTVHRARLSPAYGSKDVVIKVQAPGVERKFRADIRTCIDFCRLAMPQHVPPLEEIERQFLTEFDYREEAKNLEEVRANVLPRWSHKVDIPAPYKQLCTREVLVMDRLPGVKLVDGIRAQLAALAKVRGTTAEALEAEQRAKIASGELPPRGIAAEARATKRANAYLAANDALVRRPACFLYNRVNPARWLGLGWWQRREFVASPRLVNMGEVLQTMLDVHADEIFNHGVFNGDPHPGNILLMPDGRLGLIDYGQVKRIPESVRRCYAKLTLAILAVGLCTLNQVDPSPITYSLSNP